MNTNQKRILIVMFVLIGAMLLYPPYTLDAEVPISIRRGPGTSAPRLGTEHGYSFLFAQTGSMDESKLLVQWAGVLLMGGIGFILAKDEA